MAESLISASISGKSGSGSSIVEAGAFTKAEGVSKVIEGSILFVFTDTYYIGGGWGEGTGPCACFCEVGGASKNVYGVYVVGGTTKISITLLLNIRYSSDFTVSITSYCPESGLYLVLG